MARADSFPLKVRMTKTKQASPNGFRVDQFYEGQEYSLTAPLAVALAGSFEIAKEEMKTEEMTAAKKVEKKNQGAAPKNKMASIKENK